jgi:hypothetical protein
MRGLKISAPAYAHCAGASRTRGLGWRNIRRSRKWGFIRGLKSHPQYVKAKRQMDISLRTPFRFHPSHPSCWLRALRWPKCRWRKVWIEHPAIMMDASVLAVNRKRLGHQRWIDPAFGGAVISLICARNSTLRLS